MILCKWQARTQLHLHKQRMHVFSACANGTSHVSVSDSKWPSGPHHGGWGGAVLMDQYELDALGASKT